MSKQPPPQPVYTISVYRIGGDLVKTQRVAGLKHAKVAARRALQHAIRLGCYVVLTDEKGQRA